MPSGAARVARRPNACAGESTSGRRYQAAECRSLAPPSSRAPRCTSFESGRSKGCDPPASPHRHETSGTHAIRAHPIEIGWARVRNEGFSVAASDEEQVVDDSLQMGVVRPVRGADEIAGASHVVRHLALPLCQQRTVLKQLHQAVAVHAGVPGRRLSLDDRVRGGDPVCDALVEDLERHGVGLPDLPQPDVVRPRAVRL